MGVIIPSLRPPRVAVGSCVWKPLNKCFFFPSFIHSLPLPHPSTTQPPNIFLMTSFLSATVEGASGRGEPRRRKEVLATGNLSPSPPLWLSVWGQQSPAQVTGGSSVYKPGLGAKLPTVQGRCAGWTSPILGPQPALPTGLLTLFSSSWAGNEL